MEQFYRLLGLIVFGSIDVRPSVSHNLGFGRNKLNENQEGIPNAFRVVWDKFFEGHVMHELFSV